MSDQDTVDITERLEMARTKQGIVEHATKLQMPIAFAAGDIIVKSTLLALARKVPPTLILNGTIKLIQAVQEMTVEELLEKLNMDTGDLQVKPAEEEFQFESTAPANPPADLGTTEPQTGAPTAKEEEPPCQN